MSVNSLEQPRAADQGQNGRWKLVAVLGGLGLLALFLVRWLPNQLIVEDRLPPSVDAILLYGGDNRHAIAAQWLAAGQARIVLLPRDLPNRNRLLGIAAPGDVFSRKTLIRLGVPNEAIETLDNDDQSGEWKYVRLARQWLEQHPQANVVVFCDRFHTRETRYAVNCLLSDQEGRRIGVYGLASKNYGEKQWWQSRRGAVDFFNALVGLIYNYCAGEDPDRPVTWDVDDFERGLGHP